jgi:hypothetical protein
MDGGCANAAVPPAPLALARAKGAVCAAVSVIHDAAAVYKCQWHQHLHQRGARDCSAVAWKIAVQHGCNIIADDLTSRGLRVDGMIFKLSLIS